MTFILTFFIYKAHSNFSGYTGITQYGSTVYNNYRDCYGLSPLKTIYKDFVHFHFQFEVDFNDIKVKNVLQITIIQKLEIRNYI